METSVGSVVSGNLHPAAIMDSLARLLWKLDKGKKHKYFIFSFLDLDSSGKFSDDPEVNLQIYSLNQGMMEALNDFAPPFCKFGAHDGTYSDYGYWPSITTLENAILDGEVLEITSLSDVPDDYYGFILLVDEIQFELHCAMRLYSKEVGSDPVMVWEYV